MSLLLNIADLLSGEIVEGTRMEFKEGWNPKTIMRSVCAFANDFENEGSGYIILGVKEENGKPIRPVLGFDPDQFESVQREMIGCCNLIQPAYNPKLSLETIDGKHVLVIWVPAGTNRPYKVPDDVLAKHKIYNYRIRQYSSSVIPNPDQELELVQLTAQIPFDDRINSKAQVTDLSYSLMREHLDKTKSKLYEESVKMNVTELANQMNLSQGAKEHLFPKNVGLLLFSENPQLYFKGAQIDLVEFPEGLEGKNFTEKIFTGPIQKQLIAVLSYIRTNVIKTKITKHADREEADTVFNYPFDAIEEALSNAVYHRNYELQEPIEVRILPNAIEIISYSGADPSLKQSDFDKGVVRARRYRNRRIGEFLKELRLTEGRGTGIPTIKKALLENGSDEAKFDMDEPHRRHFIIEIPIHWSFRVITLTVEQKEMFNQAREKLAIIADYFAKQKYHPSFKTMEKHLETAKLMTRQQLEILEFVKLPKKKKEILEDCLHLTNQTKNFTTNIQPLLDLKLIRMTIKDKPNSQSQQYVISNAGKVVSYVRSNFKAEDL